MNAATGSSVAPTAPLPRHSTDEDEEKIPSPSLIQKTDLDFQHQSAQALDPSTVAEDDQEYLTGIKLFMTMLSLTFVVFLILLDVSIVATAVPKITTQFHSLDDVGWYGAAYILASCACQPLSGKIYGNFDSKRVFLGFFGIFELGSLLCATATSSNMLIIGRTIAGIGSTGILNGGYTIVHASAPLHQQPLLLGILMGLSQLGSLSGPLIGGALTEYASWRWCFYINLPCGAVATVLLLFVTLPRQPIKASGTRTVLSVLGSLDLVGFFLFAPASVQFLLALQWGGTRYSWHSATIIGLFCGSFGTLLIFIAWEHYMGSEAMIPLSIISRRVIWTSCSNYGLTMGSSLTISYYLPIYFQAVRNATPALSGVYLLPLILSAIMFVVATGGLLGRVGYYLPFAVAGAAIATVASGLLTTFTPSTTTGVWIGYQIIAGVGRGMSVQIPLIAVQNNCSKDELPIVNALVVFAQNLGAAVSLSLAELIFNSVLRHDLAIQAPQVNPELVIAAGATALDTVVPAASLPGVLLAYSNSVNSVMYLATGASGGALLLAFGMGWRSIKKAKVA